MTKAVTDERLAELVQGHEAVPDWSQLKQFSAEILGCLRELQELRSALTASGKALREYGHHKNSCRFVSNVPNPGIRPGSCTCGLEAALEKANG